MSFAGFVFDMIRRDKENRNLRLLRRERLNERLDKMHKGAACLTIQLQKTWKR